MLCFPVIIEVEAQVVYQLTGFQALVDLVDLVEALVALAEADPVVAVPAGDKINKRRTPLFFNSTKQHRDNRMG